MGAPGSIGDGAFFAIAHLKRSCGAFEVKNAPSQIRLPGSKDTVSGIPKSWNNIFMLIQMVIQCADI